MKLTRVLCVVVVAAGCGGSDDSEVEALCDDLREKIRECNINVDTSGGCNTDASEAVKCSAQCIIDADCEQVTGAPQNNSFYECQAVCSGASPDDFICADGSGFLPQAGVCDGTEQCPDASDEADCGM
jgi:hypothetical protein